MSPSTDMYGQNEQFDGDIVWAREAELKFPFMG